MSFLKSFLHLIGVSMRDEQEASIPSTQQKPDIISSVVEKITTTNPLDEIAKQYAKFRDNNMDNQAAWTAITTIHSWTEDESKMKLIELKLHLEKDSVANAIILAQLAEKKNRVL